MGWFSRKQKKVKEINGKLDAAIEKAIRTTEMRLELSAFLHSMEAGRSLTRKEKTFDL